MIIADSSPLILLAKINKLALLKNMYKMVYVPESVYREVVIRGKEEQYGDAYLIERSVNDFISVKKVNEVWRKNMQEWNEMLGKGESEAIALALQEKATLLLMDNKEPREVAESKNIRCRSTPGILLEALKRKKINHEEYREMIMALASFAWLSGDIVAYFLNQGYIHKERENHENK